MKLIGLVTFNLYRLSYAKQKDNSTGALWKHNKSKHPNTLDQGSTSTPSIKDSFSGKLNAE